MHESEINWTFTYRGCVRFIRTEVQIVLHWKFSFVLPNADVSVMIHICCSTTIYMYFKRGKYIYITHYWLLLIFTEVVPNNIFQTSKIELLKSCTHKLNSAIPFKRQILNLLHTKVNLDAMFNTSMIIFCSSPRLIFV